MYGNKGWFCRVSRSSREDYNRLCINTPEFKSRYYSLHKPTAQSDDLPMGEDEVALIIDKRTTRASTHYR